MYNNSLCFCLEERLAEAEEFSLEIYTLKKKKVMNLLPTDIVCVQNMKFMQMYYVP